MAASDNLSASTDQLENGRVRSGRKVRDVDQRNDDNGPEPDLGTVAESKADTTERVEVAASEGCATWDHDAPLILRLLRVQKAVATLEMDATIEGRTKNDKRYSYHGITSAQIVQRAKEILTQHGILYWPEYNKDDAQINGNMTSVYLTGIFINVDDPADQMKYSAWGSDTDNAGKGFMKALTNANKQVLSKALMMSTVEEMSAEANEVPHEREGESTAVKQAEALTDAAIKAWADSYKSALQTCTDIKALRTLRAENSHMMNHKDVPQVTKDYFADLIAGKEGELTS